MTPKTRTILIIGGVIAAVFTAVGIYAYRQYKLLYNYCYAMTGAVIKSFGLNKIAMTIMVKLKNRSDITIELGDQSYDVFINDYYISTIKYTKPASWVSKSSVTFPLDLEFAPKDLLKAGLKNIQEFVTDKNKIIIKIVGFVNAKAGVISIKDLKFEYEMSLAELLAPSEEIEACKSFK